MDSSISKCVEKSTCEKEEEEEKENDFYQRVSILDHCTAQHSYVIHRLVLLQIRK